MAGTLTDSLFAPLPLVLLAVGAGLLWPSPALADRSDLILAALVLAVALTIDPRRLRDAARERRRVAAAVVLPLVLLLPLAVALAALFDGATHDGLIALGLAPTEVATAGLVALAGGDAALALTVVTLSLGLTAVAAPVLAPLLVDTSIAPGDLLVRFSVVVLVPLAIGLVIRARVAAPRLEAWADRAAMLALAFLVYAALGDLGEVSELGGAIAASALFLIGSIALAVLLRPLLGGAPTGGFVFALRDFAVAAALAGQFDAPGAGATPAIYGVLMLTCATIATTLLRRSVRTAAGSGRSPTA